MTVESRIVDIRAPLREFKRDEEFQLEIDVDTTGTGASRLLLALYDRGIGQYIAAWATVDPLPPGGYTWLVTLNPLDEWGYPPPLPGIFHWTAKVGYMEDASHVFTDSRDFRMARIVDRLCVLNYDFCVGVSNPYPAPGEEIAITGHISDTSPIVQPFLLTSDGKEIMRVGGRMTHDLWDPEQYFAFWINAPRFEGGYTYWVTYEGPMPMTTPPIGIWVSPPPACEDYTTEEECERAGCYWYDHACHSAPAPPPLSWFERHKKEVAILGGMGAGVGVLIIRKI